MNPFKTMPKKMEPKKEKVADSPAFVGDARPGGASDASKCHHNWHVPSSGQGSPVCYHCGQVRDG